jgi:hypothetical protein
MRVYQISDQQGCVYNPFILEEDKFSHALEDAARIGLYEGGLFLIKSYAIAEEYAKFLSKAYDAPFYIYEVEVTFEHLMKVEINHKEYSNVIDA